MSDAIRSAAKLVNLVYSYSDMGGNAHVVLDDGNIEDYYIDWCLNEALDNNVWEASEEQLKTERDCLLALKTLNIEEREEVLRISDRIFTKTIYASCPIDLKKIDDSFLAEDE